jgi:cell wall assembly regulator SMI1
MLTARLIRAEDSMMPGPHDLATWASLLRLLRDDPLFGARVVGGIHAGGKGRVGVAWNATPPSHHLWSVFAKTQELTREPGDQPRYDAMMPIWRALERESLDEIRFSIEYGPSDKVVLHLIGSNPASQSALVPSPELVLVEGAVPEPWRRRAEPALPGAPAGYVDLALLERTLRERLPVTPTGATEEEIAAAESRLGVSLPEEFKVLYRVIGPEFDPYEHEGAVEALGKLMGCFPGRLSDLRIADHRSVYRQPGWDLGSSIVVTPPPNAAVQSVVGSPGWVVFWSYEGGDYAVDLTPGPGGHVGQIIMLAREDYVGADLVADSLTDLVVNGARHGQPVRHVAEDLPAIARVNHITLPSVAEAASPELEVLMLGVVDTPQSLAAVAASPRLRTLEAYPGTLTDPLEIAKLRSLEYLKIGADDWRVLLAADAVPDSLLAAGISGDTSRDHLPTVLIQNEILAQAGWPLIDVTTIEGNLG